MENIYAQYLTALGHRIRQLRSEAGLNQVQLAAKAGLPTTYCSQLERGKRNISALTLVRLASALNVEVGMLFPTLTEEHAKRDEYDRTAEYSEQDKTGHHVPSQEVTHSAIQEARFLSAGAAAEVLGVSSRTVERWTKSGRLSPAARVEDQHGKLYAVYAPEDVARLRRQKRHISWSEGAKEPDGSTRST